MGCRATTTTIATTLTLALGLGACVGDVATGDTEAVDAGGTAGDPDTAAQDAPVEPETATDEAGDALVGVESHALSAQSSSDAGAPLAPDVRFEPAAPPEVPAGIGPFVAAADDPLSTFALDVDTSSWTQTLRWLAQGERPPPSIVRPEEFLNWFDYGYQQPEEGWDSSVDGVLASPWNEQTALLRIGLATAGLDPADRPDATLTFVVDTSGSMAGTPLATVKEALALLVRQLRPTDRIGLVEYGSVARTLLEPTSLAESEVVLDAIDGLQSDGSTNVAEGLRVGYELAQRNLTPGGIDVVVLASDGVANVGTTDADGILSLIDDGVGSGIDLLALGVDEQGYNDHLMEQLSNRGNGATYYLRGPQDAERLFVDELEQTLVVAARDTKVQVSFDPAVVARYRLVGYDNRAVADDDFRDDTVDAGEVGVGHEVTAIYELELVAGASPTSSLGRIQLRWEDPDAGQVREAARDVFVSDLRPDPATGFGTAVQAVALAEVLRGSPHVEMSLDDLAGFDRWGTSAEATEAIRLAADARPGPGG